MSNKLCRWGILGSSGIARKNWQSIRNSGNGELVAVASRSEERALEYIRENQAQVPHPVEPRPIGGYQNMIESEDIDAIYIPLPTGLRKEYVIAAARAGKHVMCEKPCGTNADDLREMIAACEENGVQFMDGVMYLHSDRLPALREVLDDGDSVGDIKRIMNQFSFRAPDDFLQENIRMHSELEPLGCLGDLGWYNIGFSLWVMNYTMPQKVTGRMISQSGRSDSPGSVPLQFSGELIFDNNVTAGFYCSFETEHQQWANISGTKGYIQLRDFVLPFYGSTSAFEVNNAVFSIDKCRLHMEDHRRTVSVPEYSDSHATSQETKLFRDFGDLVLSGKVDAHWPEVSLKTQLVMDACLKSANNGGVEVEI
ncbi:MAG: Gfo/Idh/MocA family oxidoreductase [Verrucomicrobiales bacterium]|nr:Gfo/Idh/MocA family oxidoreductase [Verrucomicrobiales bacterium]